jgi:predicted RNA-binding Zn-ribbon protein involved in translation (DUF1610 family)
MTKTPELYCSHCQKPVTPIRGLVNFHCPKCGATFMASQIEQASAKEHDQPSPDSPQAEMAV